jgi:hypothetical protein
MRSSKTLWDQLDNREITPDIAEGGSGVVLEVECGLALVQRRPPVRLKADKDISGFSAAQIYH